MIILLGGIPILALAQTDNGRVAGNEHLLGPSAVRLHREKDSGEIIRPDNRPMGSIDGRDCLLKSPGQLQLSEQLFSKLEYESADPLTPDASAQAVARSEFRPILIYTTVNGYEYRQPGLYMLKRCGSLLVREQDLQSWRFATEQQPKIHLNGVPFIDVAHYPGVRFAIDASAQTIRLEGEPWVFIPNIVDFDQRRFAPLSNQRPGSFINWGVFNGGLVKEPSSVLQGFLTGGAFGKLGVLTSGVGLALDVKTGDFFQSRASTTFQRDFQKTATSIRLGDINARGGSLFAGPSMAGIQFGRNFATQPGRILTPVNDYDFGLRRLSHNNVGPGSFFQSGNERPGSIYNTLGQALPYGPIQYRNMPVGGNNRYYFDYTDLHKERNTYNEPYFYNAGLIRQGLYDYSIELGILRGGELNNRGPNTYETTAASTYHRYGFNRWVTGEMQASWSKQRTVYGFSVLSAIPYLGVVNIGIAESSESDIVNASGQRRYILGVANSWRRFSYGFRRLVSDSDFRPVQSGRGINVVSDVNTAYLGASLPWRDSVTFRFVDEKRRSEGEPNRFLDVEYSIGRIRNVRVNLYAHKDFGKGLDPVYGINISSSVTLQRLLNVVTPGAPKAYDSPFGRKEGFLAPSNTSIGYGVDSDFKRASAGISLGTGETIGRHSINASVNQNGTYDNRYETQPWTAALNYRYDTPFLLNYFGLQYSDDNATYSGGLLGGMLWLNKKIHFSQPIYGSFALIQLGKDLAGAKVNGQISDKNGDAVVTGLSPYVFNPIRIDLEDIPLNVDVQNLQAYVVPANLSAAQLDFSVPVVRDGLIQVYLQSGSGTITAFPPGSYALIQSRDGEPPKDNSERFPTGLDGAVYLYGLGRTNEITLRWAGRQCTVSVDTPEKQTSDSTPDLGVYVCKE